MIRGGVLLFMTRGLAVGGKITLNNQNPEVWCSAIRRNAKHPKEREHPIVLVSVFVCLWLQRYLLMRSPCEASRGGGECIRTWGPRTVNTLWAPTVCNDYIIRIYFNHNRIRCKHTRRKKLGSIKSTTKIILVCWKDNNTRNVHISLYFWWQREMFFLRF